MIGNVKLHGRFRSLTPDTFENGAKFGKRTVIYGHNGSGKSTFAELLHQVGDGVCAEPISFVDESQKRVKLPPGKQLRESTLTVFSKSWIQENLESFLDGDEAAAIVMLGSAAVDAKKRQKKHEEELQKLMALQPDACDKANAAANATAALVSAVQDSIVGTLSEVDHRQYSKNRYSVPRVRKLLSEATADYPSLEEHERNLEEVARGPLPTVAIPPPPDGTLGSLRDEVWQLLKRNSDGQLISDLLGKGELQRWLETGLRLHEGKSDCYFCEGPLDGPRLIELRNHFDDSRRQIQTEADELLARVANVQLSYEQWESQLPGEDDLYSDLREKFVGARDDAVGDVGKVRQFLTTIKQNLTEKRHLPEKCDFAEPGDVPSLVSETVIDLVRQHNGIAKEAGSRQESIAEAILAHLLGERAADFRELCREEGKAFEERDRIASEITQIEQLLTRARAERYSSHEMAQRISSDLASIYGKSHLTIEVSSDGQSYRCRRDGEPAKNLSEGERNAVALIYFLRCLEDETVEIRPEERIVVIDDPSSSFDREAVFSTHSWLLDLLPRYGQTIILTHDFEMLRLLIASQKSQLTKSHGILKKLSSNSASEREAAKAEDAFPRVSFLEMRCVHDANGRRASELKPVSPILLQHNSEYHFLFDRLLSGLENPDDHTTLFLLPNAARRLLESFASFQLPHMSEFRSQIEKLAVEDCQSEFRDVYDFCNRFSHGEGREAQLALDVSLTRLNIRRCVELLRSVDGEHYRYMCQATGRNDDPLNSIFA
ncbi:AAA family ATPase [Brevibacterium luteolum]|uniref:AAA family ATPase n=1 Tax=Brevibacterium luteolum TaxID=199591 RepID=UPI001C24BE26|nr:AAA family ATPase [Brevibacterium luteolum]